MKSTDFKRRPPGLSGSAWQRINQIVTGTGKYSPAQLAKRAARRTRKGANEA